MATIFPFPLSKAFPLLNNHFKEKKQVSFDMDGKKWVCLAFALGRMKVQAAF